MKADSKSFRKMATPQVHALGSPMLQRPSQEDWNGILFKNPDVCRRHQGVIDSGPEGIVYDSNSCEIRWEIPKDQPRGRGERHFPPHRLDPRGDLSH